MKKAVEYERICTPERMAALYPIFREINAEQEEIAKLRNDKRLQQQHKAKKLAKKNGGKNEKSK